jgi:hypothetical protein
VVTPWACARLIGHRRAPDTRRTSVLQTAFFIGFLLA